MFGWFKRRDPDPYKRTVDDCLTVLFCGFDNALMPALKKQIDYDGLVRSSHKNGETTPKQCSVYAVALLMGKLVDHLNPEAREQAFRAVEQQDANDAFYKGYNYMLQIADQFDNVSDQLKNVLIYQVPGKLRGLSQEQIDKWRVETEVTKVAEAYRTSAQEEAADGEGEKSVQVQLICKLVAGSAEYLAEPDSIADEMLAYERQRYEKQKARAIALAETITDEFFYDAALHSIIDLCVKAKDAKEAKALLKKVSTDFIRAKIIEAYPGLAV
jgi:hypothetical protein